MMRINLLSNRQELIGLYLSDVRRLYLETDEAYELRWKKLVKHYEESIIRGKGGE